MLGVVKLDETWTWSYPAFVPWTVAGVALAYLLFAVAACASPQSNREPAPPSLVEAIQGAVPDHFRDATKKVAAATLADAPPRYAIATVRHLGGMPLVNYDERPIAGRPWTAVFTTRPTAPYPALPMRLVVSLTPPGAEQPVQQTFLPGQAGVTQQGGKLFLDVTFPAQWVGLRLWMQAVVSDRRSLNGELVTPVLEVVVGEA